ncbi:YozQ family protein [Bacillus pinisoli]|uniref:YozQ family protein n=1 Tax=Bacillus pinisoli TaxID=2901866 RepID=UPI001FF138B7|nr:YozQ family protein [Bacillus pinisoli]
MAKKEELAGKQFDPSFYENANEVEAGLATTHEQATDSYIEGTVDGNVDKQNSSSRKKK